MNQPPASMGRTSLSPLGPVGHGPDLLFGWLWRWRQERPAPEQPPWWPAGCAGPVAFGAALAGRPALFLQQIGEPATPAFLQPASVTRFVAGITDRYVPFSESGEPRPLTIRTAPGTELLLSNQARLGMTAPTSDGDERPRLSFQQMMARVNRAGSTAAVFDPAKPTEPGKVGLRPGPALAGKTRLLRRPTFSQMEAFEPDRPPTPAEEVPTAGTDREQTGLYGRVQRSSLSSTTAPVGRAGNGSGRLGSEQREMADVSTPEADHPQPSRLRARPAQDAEIATASARPAASGTPALFFAGEEAKAGLDRGGATSRRRPAGADEDRVEASTERAGASVTAAPGLGEQPADPDPLPEPQPAPVRSGPRSDRQAGPRSGSGRKPAGHEDRSLEVGAAQAAEPAGPEATLTVRAPASLGLPAERSILAGDLSGPDLPFRPAIPDEPGQPAPGRRPPSHLSARRDQGTPAFEDADPPRHLPKAKFGVTDRAVESPPDPPAGRDRIWQLRPVSGVDRWQPRLTGEQVTRQLVTRGWRFKRKAGPVPVRAEAAAESADRLEGATAPGRVLPAGPRLVLETALGRDFSRVRLHQTVPLAPLQVEAAARGRDVYLEPGREPFESPASMGLLGHELAHVVQQGFAGARSQARPGSDPAADEAEAGRSEQAVLELLRGPAMPFLGPNRPGEPVIAPVQAAVDPETAGDGRPAVPAEPAEAESPQEQASTVETVLQELLESGRLVEPRQPDLKQLARKVYPLLKRRLVRERQQRPR